MTPGDDDDEESPPDEIEEDESAPSFSSLVDAVEERKRRLSESERERAEPQSAEARTPGDGTAGFEWDQESTVRDPDDEWGMLERPGGGSFEGFGEDPKREAILEVVGDVPNVLLLGPLLCPTDYDACSRLISAVPDGTDRLLLVTLTQSPDERLNVLRGYLGDLPEETVIIDVGGSGRGGTRSSVSTEGDREVTIEAVSDPTDLRRVGILISRYLSDWAAEGATAVLCVHSLTALLQFVEDTRFVFRFLHVLQQKVRSAGATAHYHLDTGGHDGDLVERFRPLVDETLAYGEDGSLSVVH